jgi:hypothetical protein
VVALLALDDGVRLGCFKNSHKCTKKHPNNTHLGEAEMIFFANEAMMFHPLLQHYGWGYGIDIANLRVHFYFDSKKVIRRKSAVDGGTLTHIVTVPEAEPKTKKAYVGRCKAKAVRAEKKIAKGLQLEERKRLKKITVTVVDDVEASVRTA